MSAQREQHALFTEAEYYYVEDHSVERNEFFRGEIFRMADTTPKHNDIAGNIYTSLRAQLRGKSCRARISDQHLRVEANGLITYPAISVVCPPFRFDPDNKITLLDATVIVEVLSDSTRKYDKAKSSTFCANSLRSAIIFSSNPTPCASNTASKAKAATGKPKFLRRSMM